MPETSMNYNKRAIFWKHNIRLARNIFCMKPETEAKGVKPLSEENFRASVFRSDTGHHAAAGSRVNNVRHLASS
jgi:hypothetical protein